ncbi:MAG: hypothetical protein ACLGHZ_04665 [Actinomycetes bacterium]
MRRLVTLLTGALLAAGCSAVPGEGASPVTLPPSATRAPTPVGPTASDEGGPSASGGLVNGQAPGGPGTPVPLPEDLKEAIRTDLEARDVDASRLVVVSSLGKTWSDGSWGCPEPGMAYTQALVPGLHVIVEADGIQYDYRFGDGPTPRLCVPLSLR